jgi:hypothetical protein
MIEDQPFQQPLLYTYEDEEPATIEVGNTWDFNGKTHITREELVDFSMTCGVGRPQAIKKAELEFEARAPNYGVWGENAAGPSDWDIAGPLHATQATHLKKNFWGNAMRFCDREKEYYGQLRSGEGRPEYSTRYHPGEEQPRRRKSRANTYSSSNKEQTSERPEYSARYYPDEDKSRSSGQSSSTRSGEREYSSKYYSDDEEFILRRKSSSKSYSSSSNLSEVRDQNTRIHTPLPKRKNTTLVSRHILEVIPLRNHSEAMIIEETLQTKIPVTQVNPDLTVLPPRNRGTGRIWNAKLSREV